MKCQWPERLETTVVDSVLIELLRGQSDHCARCLDSGVIRSARLAIAAYTSGNMAMTTYSCSLEHVDLELSERCGDWLPGVPRAAASAVAADRYLL
jgi:hypothetical protein